MRSTLILLFIIMISACTKDNFVPSIPKNINEIDSIVLFYIDEDSDTLYNQSIKYIYGENYSYIRIIKKSDFETYDITYPIINNKITINQNNNSYESKTEYFLNNKHFLIKERMVNKKTNRATDSTIYKYDAFDRLIFKSFFGNTWSGEGRVDETHNYHYFWQEDNMVKIICNKFYANNIQKSSFEKIFTYNDEINPLSFFYSEANLMCNPIYRSGISSKNLLNENSIGSNLKNTYKFFPELNLMVIEQYPNTQSVNVAKIFYK